MNLNEDIVYKIFDHEKIGWLGDDLWVRHSKSSRAYMWRSKPWAKIAKKRMSIARSDIDRYEIIPCKVIPIELLDDAVGTDYHFEQGDNVCNLLKNMK